MTILADVSKLAKLHGVTIVVIQPDAPAIPTHAVAVPRKLKPKPKLAQVSSAPIQNGPPYSMPKENRGFCIWLTKHQNMYGISDAQLAKAMDWPLSSAHSMRLGHYVPGGDRQRELRAYFASLASGSKPEPKPTGLDGRSAPRVLNIRRRGPPYAMPKPTQYTRGPGLTFGRWLTKQLNAHNMTMGDVAEAAGITRDGVAMIRLGNWYPSEVLRAKLESLFAPVTHSAVGSTDVDDSQVKAAGV